jgi:hypothetical protein
MKKKIISALTIAIMLIVPLFVAAQSDGPGNPGDEPNGPPLGGGAPIGSGVGILILLGAAYGGKKLYHLYTDQKEDLQG